MLPFRKIIFPVDYSDSCAAAVPFVKELTRRYSAQLSLLHAYGSLTAYSDWALADPSFADRVRRAEIERLRKFAAEMFPGLYVETNVQSGEPAHAIQDLILTQQADLVMMPTHGRGLLRRMLLGSITTKVLHDVSTAVWTATGEALDGTHVPPKSVLCACDVNDPEESAIVIKAAASLACKSKSALSLLSVVQVVPVSIEIDTAFYQDTLTSAANEALREIKAQLNINAPHSVIEGPVAEKIREEALRTHADLIVTGRGHQQGNVSQAWSNLYEIVRDAPCPVLSI